MVSIIMRHAVFFALFSLHMPIVVRPTMTKAPNANATEKSCTLLLWLTKAIDNFYAFSSKSLNCD